MRRTLERLGNRRGIALIATLALLIFLAAMMGAVFRANITQRRYLNVRQDSMAALCLAESGVQEALQALASNRVLSEAEGKPEESLRRAVGDGSFHAKRSPVPSAANVYEITSTGIAHPGDPVSPRKTIKVRVQVQRAGTSVGLRVLSWQQESR